MSTGLDTTGCSVLRRRGTIGKFERLITSYCDTGMAAASFYVYQPLSFEPGMSLIVMTKLLVAAMVVLPAPIAVGVVLAAAVLAGAEPSEVNRGLLDVKGLLYKPQPSGS